MNDEDRNRLRPSDQDEARQSWRVRQPFLHEVRPPLADLLDQARRLEGGLRQVRQPVDPASVLVRTTGLDVAVTLTAATEEEALRRGLAVIRQVAAAARIDDLGTALAPSVRPAGRPAR